MRTRDDEPARFGFAAAVVVGCLFWSVGGRMTLRIPRDWPIGRKRA